MSIPLNAIVGFYILDFDISIIFSISASLIQKLNVPVPFFYPILKECNNWHQRRLGTLPEAKRL